jgi:hypothetical protein
MNAGIATAAFRQVNRFVEPVVKSGVASLFPIGPALVVLETVGRRTSKVRTVPVLALRFGSKVFVGTLRGDSQWMANVGATPQAAIWLGGHRRAGQATVHREGLIEVVSITMDPNDKPTSSSSNVR